MLPLPCNSSISCAPGIGAVGRKAFFSGVIFLLLLWLAFFSLAAKAQFAISQSPLTSGAGVAANLLYIHDDSGSMAWSFMPDSRVGPPVGSTSAKQFMSSNVNIMYFNPNVDYRVPLMADGAPMADSTFESAWSNGYDLAGRDTAGTYDDGLQKKVNLGVAYRPTNYYGGSYGSYGCAFIARFYGVVRIGNSLYYACFDTNPVHNVTPPIGWPDVRAYRTGSYVSMFIDRGAGAVPPTDGNGRPIHYYDPVTGAAVRILSASDPGGNTPYWARMRQNFANWYSYYRTRNYTARAGVSRAFVDVDSDIRIGWGRINYGRVTATEYTAHEVDGKSIRSAVMRGVQPFTGSHKKDFYDWIFKAPASGGTPLRLALDSAGQYYDRAGSNHAGPWADNPALGAGTKNASCRKSFTILMTDGYWNEAGAEVASGNQDAGDTFTTPQKADGGTETWSKRPFSDDYSDTLADVAWHYWAKDLYGDASDNKLSGAPSDPAWWQHMTTFTIGLGVAPSSVAKADAFAAAHETPTTLPGKNITWPNGGNYQIDDLMHAGVNGHGEFFAANNATEFVNFMKAMLASVKSAGSNSKLAKIDDSGQNKDKVTGASLAYEVRYDATDWHGQVLAYKICTADEVKKQTSGCVTEGQVKTTAEWDADVLLKSKTDRNILSWNTETGKGIPFLLKELSAAQKEQLVRGPLDPSSATPQLDAPNGQAILDYVRGDASKEPPHTPAYRARNQHRLGDIFSDPVYFGPSFSRGYEQASGLGAEERTAYDNWKKSEAYADSPGMLFVGANDGMLHGFKADDGSEQMAYVPASVIPKLWKLADPNYVHEFYADATPTVQESWFGANKGWRNVLVGSAGAGGNSYFALDVSNPTTAATPAERVLWEFTHDELGYNGAGRATVARLKGKDGKWVAIFGNGYNSKHHTARLFVVDLQTGLLVRSAIDTGVGDASRPNGLSAPKAVDSDLSAALGSADQDGVVDVVYAGDVRGNLWRFDLSDEDPDNWSFSKLLEAKGPTGAEQPITAQPLVVRRRDSAILGNMVYVGTGKFFERADLDDASVQTLYAVLDTGSGGTYSRNNGLTQQSVTDSGMENGRSAQNTTSNPVNYTSGQRGFFLDLSASKERVLAQADYLARSRTSGSVLFYSLTPSDDPCRGGRTGWVTELDAMTGAKSTKPILFSDFNRVQMGSGAGGLHTGGKGGYGKFDDTNCSGDGCERYVKTCDGMQNFGGGDSKALEKCATKQGRQSWRQLR
jgi:type IV pilus assembly protein PilY1